MSGALLISSILVLVLKSQIALCGTINQGFGYEILVTKIETLEERLNKLDRTLQNSSTSIMSELNNLRELIKSQQNTQQKVHDSCDKVPSKVSGVFNVQLNPQESARIYCEQKYDGGGWAVIQWRFDGSTNFYRGWTEYKRGFGNLNGGEFWLGLEVIHQLTYSGPHEMVILLEDFEGNSTYAKLDRFEMAGEQEVYKVTMADGYSGTAGDSISGIKNFMFSTFDKDSDTYPGNCALDYHGAWWYSKCHSRLVLLLNCLKINILMYCFIIAVT